MKPARFRITRPSTVDELVRVLDAGDAADMRILSGGQSLMPMLSFRLAAPAMLVDVSRIDALRGITLEPGGALRIGATTTHRDVERSALVAQHVPLLPHALHYVAHVAIRNKGTLGGSLAHSDPSAEWPALCMLCDAEIEVRSMKGSRRIEADKFLLGMFTTDLQPGEVLAAVRFPVWNPGRRWGFQEVSRRLGDFAIVGAAAWADVDPQGRVAGSRVVVFGVQDKPVLLPAVSHAMAGHVPTVSRIADAARQAAAGFECRADLHASAEYRAELMEVLVERALAQALQVGAAG